MEIKLSQAIIIQAAFDILAETQALSQLSMRNIANRIHVQAPALYWYFKNKQQLLQKMAETMEEELALPDPTLPWNEQLLQYMENYYDLYTRFPCGAELEINTVPALLAKIGMPSPAAKSIPRWNSLPRIPKELDTTKSFNGSKYPDEANWLVASASSFG